MMMSDGIETDSDIEFTDYDMDASETSLLVNKSQTESKPRSYENDQNNTEREAKSSSIEKTHRTPCFIWLLSFFAAVGGFLFGYDTGVVSGAMLLLTKTFDLSYLWQEIIVSATIAFAFLFALVGGILNDVFGRKITTLIASFVFTIGAVVLGIAQNVAMLVIGRSILGIGIGN